MKPYCQDNHCTIYNADCKDLLCELPQFDLLLTDPSYGMSYQSNYRKVKHSKILNDESLPLELILKFQKKAFRCSYIFIQWKFLKEFPQPKSFIVWVKNNWTAGDLKHEHGRQWEGILFYPTENHIFIKRPSDFIFSKRTLNNLHPTEKPVSVLTQIIESNVCESILDPFMGSGTTLRAAKDLNKKAVGIELDERYCEIAAKRLEQEVFKF